MSVYYCWTRKFQYHGSRGDLYEPSWKDPRAARNSLVEKYPPFRSTSTTSTHRICLTENRWPLNPRKPNVGSFLGFLNPCSSLVMEWDDCWVLAGKVSRILVNPFFRVSSALSPSQHLFHFAFQKIHPPGSQVVKILQIICNIIIIHRYQKIHTALTVAM